MSEIRVNNIIADNGLDAVNFTKGINATGIVTATSFSGTIPSSNLSGALPAISGANLTGLSSSLSVADIWRVNAQFSSNNSYAYITSNWERADTGNSGKIGTGMTQSSGVFTYPSTGIYLVQYGAWANTTSSAHTVGINIQSTVDNGNNYTFDASSYFSIPNISTYSYGGGTCQHIFDVTNVSTHKSRMAVYSSSNVTWEGSTSGNGVYVSFIRLGDT